MDQFRKELRDLLTRYPQVESVTYKTTETLTKDSILGNTPLVPPLEVPYTGDNFITSAGDFQKKVIDTARKGMVHVNNH